MDLVSYESPNMLESLSINKLRRNENMKVDLSCIQRFVIPLVTDIKSVEEGVDLISGKSGCTAMRKGNKIILDCFNMTERGIEMPIFNRKLQGKKYRYVYAAGTFNTSCYSHTITKTDLETAETIIWKDGDYFYPGEPIFIPNPQGISEDDGILLCGLTDSRAGHEDLLLFLDPRNLTEIARAKFKSHIPAALHGLFLPINNSVGNP